MLERLRIPGLGAWGEDPLWASIYDWTVEHPQAGGMLWRAGIGSDLRRLYAAAAEIRFDGMHYRRDIAYRALRRLGQRPGKTGGSP